MQPLNIGILGVSNHFFKRCFTPLKHSKMIHVYAIASRNEVRAKQASAKWNIPKYYDSYEALIADKNLDAVYIPLPNHMHLAYIKKCADAGKHVICEKPIALNADEAMEASYYASEHGIKLMEAFMYRFHPKWQHAKKLVMQGEIGQVTSIHTIFSYHNTNPDNIRNVKAYGGGALYDIGCYAISTARFIMDKEPIRVMGQAHINPTFHVDDLTSGIMDFGGPRCLFTVGTQTFPDQEVTIHGTAGIITVTIPFNDIPEIQGKILVKTSAGKRVITFDPIDQYQLEFEAFAKAVREDLPVPLSPTDSIGNMKVIDALFQSAKTGQWVTL